MDFDAATTFAVFTAYFSAFPSQHADFRALIKPLPRQPHDKRLQLLVRERHATIESSRSADEAAFVESSRTQPETEAVVHQYLHAIAALVHEQIGMVGTRLAEHVHYARQCG